MSRAARFDEVVHAPNRLQICAMLSAVDSADFATVRDGLGDVYKRQVPGRGDDPPGQPGAGAVDGCDGAGRFFGRDGGVQIGLSEVTFHDGKSRAYFPSWQVTASLSEHVLIHYRDRLITAVLAGSSCLGRDRDQDLPVANHRAVRREVRGRGEGEQVIAEHEPAFGGECLGRFECGPVVGQEEVGEELR